MINSIAQMGSQMQAFKTGLALSTSIAKKGLDQQKQEGALALKLIESASIGRNINVKA